ncbi:WAS/WASL-interacting protein family member 3-like [Calypte anna]|uniref:WAS/WASL-interacting protein family member 3-like n=1 Tax=Calypte anna TaxID=9244 RepID=UPI0011C3524A|nr:WAS/WASL-interacting protein family member 3-like [Calypte anna]
MTDRPQAGDAAGPVRFPPGLERPPSSRESPLQLLPPPPRPPPPLDQGRLQPWPAELPPADPTPAGAQRLSPHGVARALRSPEQHKPGLSTSLQEVSCDRSGRAKQKLQSWEQDKEEEEEEGQHKQKSEGHRSPAARGCRAPGGSPAQRRLPIRFGGGSASQAAPGNRRSEEQADEPALSSSLACLPAAAARPARRNAAEPRPRSRPPAPRLRLPGARRGCGRAALGGRRSPGRAAPAPPVGERPPLQPCAPHLRTEKRRGLG